MCELFSMSSLKPATVTVSLSALAEHGGKTAPHKDGWGIAYYADADVRVLRDTTCASSSQWVQFVEQVEPRSTMVVSHIRKATQGDIAIRNTQPFSRELGGSMHVFAHNGHVPDARNGSQFSIDAFHPIGETDSEYAFCALLERIRPLWRNAEGIPDLAARFEVVAGFAREIGQVGVANFLYCDGEALFAHAQRRKQADGQIRPPGLHLLHRQCAIEAQRAETTGIAVASPGQNASLIASVPLTAEPWEPLPEGEVIAISAGQVVARSQL